MDFMSMSWHVLREYGPGVLVSVFALSMLGWLFRTSVRNPVEIMSRVMRDIDQARQALHEELAARDAMIIALRAEVTALETEVGRLRQKIRELRGELDDH